MLTIKRSGDIVSVQLNRPEVRNAFAPPLIRSLTSWARDAAADAGTRVAVLAGTGPVFCAGADLGWMQQMRGYDEARNLEDAGELADLFEALAQVPFPLVARAQGAALGGGAGLLAVCDHVVASSDLVVGFTEVRIGLLPAVIAPFVTRRIGWSAARSLFLTGRRIGAVDAQRIGLLHDVVPAAELDDRVAQVVDEFRAGAPEAQRATKRLLAQLEAGPPADTRDATTLAIARQRVSQEGQEGLAAFLEKRRAAWQRGQDG